jgi:GH24 family phage-related lysozyme (muramidase)
MNTGETGLNLIKAYEGLRFSAQGGQASSDGEGAWTVGYGHRATAREGQSVTEGEATRLLHSDIAPIEAVIRRTVRAPLNQNEHDALVSLIFNIGEKNFRRSTVLKKLNDGDRLGAAEAFERWTRARVDGKLVKLDGLVRRRAAEKSLFLMPTDAELVVPTSEVAPAEECDGAILPEDQIDKAPLFDWEAHKRERDRSLTPAEREGRLAALYTAQMSLSGDPSKMIIAKAEEREDIGVTVGAAMAGIVSVGVLALGLTLLLQSRWPGLAESVGIGPGALSAVTADLPLWITAAGAASTYFAAYILAKRAARHRLKKRRAVEIARVRGT